MPKLYYNGHTWQVPGQQDSTAERIDVPTSPADAAAWLNARGVLAHAGSPARPLPSQLTEAHNPELEQHVGKCATQAQARQLELAEARAARAIKDARDGAADAIANWIFDEADAHQVHQLFGALSDRFYTATKPTKNGSN